MASKYEKSCGVVPFRFEKGTAKFLLVQNIGGHWEFPKGHQDKGETDRETARREFAEETGLRVKRLFKNRYYQSYHYYWKGKKKPKKVIYFLGEVGPGEAKVEEEEISAHRWLSYHGALRKLTFKEIKKVLQEAKRELPKR